MNPERRNVDFAQKCLEFLRAPSPAAQPTASNINAAHQTRIELCSLLSSGRT
jgi:hypothetical protein